MHAQLGDYQQGLAYCQQALRLIRGLDDPINEAAILDSLQHPDADEFRAKLARFHGASLAEDP